MIVLGIGSAIVAAAAAPGEPVGAWLDAVVLVRQGSATCAGVNLGGGRVATAYHCVAPGGRPMVIGRGGERAVGRVSAAEPALDLAVIDVAPEVLDGPALSLGSSPEVGAPVWALGHPFGEEPPEGLLAGTLRWSASSGVVSAVGERVLQITAPVNPGDSGGPVVDREGRVVGIVSRRLNGEGLGFAIRAERLAALLDRPARGLSPLGGTAATALVFHGQTGLDALIAVGARVDVSLRDRWTLTLGASVPIGPRWAAARFGSAASVVAEAGTGPRLRLGRGPWAVRVDGIGGVALVDRWSRPGDDPLDVTVESEVAWEAGGAVSVRQMGFEIVAIPDAGLARASIVLRWPGVFGVF